MRLPSPSALLLSVALLGTAPLASAQAQARTGPAIEPEAVAALARMGGYLQTLQTFSVRGAAWSDQVLPQGPNVRYDSTSTMELVRPDHVRAEQSSDRRHRQVVYDGKTLSLYSKSSGYYVQAPASVSLQQLASNLQGEYGLDLPVLQLLAWADESGPRPSLQLARVVGLATIAGVPCDQYVFREADSDWQVWVQRGPQPVPRRVVRTAIGNSARPQSSADFEWTVNPAIAATDFQFKAPPGAISIPLARVKELAGPRP